MPCDFIIKNLRIIYISNKPQYLKNEVIYTVRVTNANHKYLTSSLKLEGLV